MKQIHNLARRRLVAATSAVDELIARFRHRALMVVVLVSLPFTTNATNPVDKVLLRIAEHPTLVRAVEPALREAQRLQLPTKMLISKIREGVAKRVPAPVVGTVIVRLVGELKAAAAALPTVARTTQTIETLARATLSGCSAEQLLDVADLDDDANPSASDVNLAVRRVSSLCTDLMAAGLSSSDSGALASATVLGAPGDSALDGALIRVIRDAGSPDSASMLARQVSAALATGAGIGHAIGLAPGHTAGPQGSGSGTGGLPETSNSKASKSATAPGQLKDKTVPPGQAKDKAVPPGQAKEK